MKNFDLLLVCGDIHGDLDIIPNFIRDNDLNNCGVIIAGDFGIGFQSHQKELRRLEYLNNRLKNTNSQVYVVRGNHDNPMYFTGEYDTDFVKLVPDYTILELNLLNILCVGGATSIDRTARNSYINKNNTTHSLSINKNGSDWWENEVFVYDKNKIKNLLNIDIVITHTAPNFTYPLIKGGLDYWIKNDSNLDGDITVERHNVTMLYNDLIERGNNISKWYYGHFHMSNKTYYNKTIFNVLNINEIQEIKL